MGEHEISCEHCGAVFMPTEDGMKPTCRCEIIEREIWSAQK